jgi:hypothetical protein
MRVLTIGVIVCALSMITFGCHNQAADARIVNIAIQNSWTNQLNLVELQWQGAFVPGGFIPPGASKKTLSVPWPKVEEAKLSFTDDKTQQSNTVDLSFADINRQIHSGSCRTVVIRIVSPQKVEIVKGD